MFYIVHAAKTLPGLHPDSLHIHTAFENLHFDEETASKEIFSSAQYGLFEKYKNNGFFVKPIEMFFIFCDCFAKLVINFLVKYAQSPK